MIALLAVAGAGLGLLERVQSSRIGEGLILDLRRAVFDHVQSMPVAFFTRTRTGALVSRLNNDVIGAQRAFTSALSGVLTNLIALGLTVVVMARLSWQITLLALVLLPIFVIPARRVGARVGKLEREAADHNAAMTSQMTERFSAAGAVLVKLFGRPAQESAEFGVRAARVRDIGVRSAMATEVFIRALMLVSGLAQALIYGLGGYLALRGDLAPGTVVTLALLLTRLYSPLTALATARLDVTTALVSFERVFEVLDIAPLIAERPDPLPLPDGPGLRGVRRRALLLSLRRQGVARLAGGRVRPGRPPARRGPARRVVPGGGGPDGGARGQLGRRQVDHRLPGPPALRRRRRRRPPVGRRRAGPVLRRPPGRGGDGRPRTATCSTTPSGPTSSSPGPTPARTSSGTPCAGPASTDLVRGLVDGLDTVVGERGYRLSGGERQRLTIARLLLARPRVVLLDEATAHLDSESEAAVQDALAEALSGRTALVIAHRLSTIRAADLILVVEDGQVVERGTHDELLAREGRYAHLYRTQFAGEPMPA